MSGVKNKSGRKPLEPEERATVRVVFYIAPNDALLLGRWFEENSELSHSQAIGGLVQQALRHAYAKQK